SGLLDSVFTPGSGGGGGESAVAAAQGYYHLKLIHAQVTVPAPPGVEHTVDLVEIDGRTAEECYSAKLGDCLCASCQPTLSVDGRDDGKRPLLARAAGALARLLFRFWPLRLLICMLGLITMITVAVLVPLRLELGLDLLRLTPQGSIEREFVAASGRALGLCNFDLIARGTDLPSTTVAPLPTHVRAHTGDVTISTSAASVSSSSSPSSTGPLSMGSTAALSGPGIDFASSQARLRELYRAISDLPGVSLNGRRVWLDAMADWLETVQAAFDRDRDLGYISSTGFWTANASALGVLGLRLIVQTNHGLQLGRIITARLVTDRIIDRTGFNIFLRVWRNHDILNYTSPPCVIFPDPGLGHDLHPFMPTEVGGGPHDLSPIRPAVPTEYVQTSFFASGYATVESQIELVKKIRQLTERATAQGVPVFPIGSLFTIADQHLRLWRHLGVAFGALAGFVFVLGLILLPNPVAALLAVLVGGGGAICACFAGLFCLGLDLNPISACLLLISFGIGSKLAAGVTTSWYGPQHNIHRLIRPNNVSYGDRGHPCHDIYTVLPPPKEASASTTLGGQVGRSSSSANRMEQRQSRRLTSLLQNHMGPVLHALVSLFLAVAFLGGSSVDFVADHFFRLVGLICIACLFDTLLFLPVIFYTLERIWPSNVFVVVESPQPLRSVHSRNPQMHYEDCSLLQLTAATAAPGQQSSCPRRQRDQPTMVEGDPVSNVHQSSSSDVGAASESAAANTANSTFHNPPHRHHHKQQQQRNAEEDENLGGEDGDEVAMREFYDCLKYASSTAFLRGGACALPLPPAPPSSSGCVLMPMRSASRPSSLSTILEEPSHSSSTVSLHQLDSPPSATDSSGPPGCQRPNALPAHAASSSPEAWFHRIFAVAAAAAGAAASTPAACHLSIKYPLDFSGTVVSGAGRGQPPLPLLPPAQVKELIEAFMRSSQIRPEDLTPFSCPHLVPPPPPYSSVATSAPPSSLLRSRVRASPSEKPPSSFLPQDPSSSHPSTSSSLGVGGSGSIGC
ncbi:unnamed protein product, partial [Schistocephalus solidus]|uniref:SSD domain-containing protein n=1 Tax=Schistocephalus solidus TaxID=70667 RepID=A0A183TAJ7_SCHSO